MRSRTRSSQFGRSAAVVGLLLALATVAAGCAPARTSDPRTASVLLAPVTALPPTGAGIDISFPQCAAKSHVDLPASIPFAIVGVNGGSANNDNPCLQSEFNSALLMAGASGEPHAALYVNTGNPALAGAWWPTGDKTQSGGDVANPDGKCVHKAGPACAYVYGYSMAEADVRRAHSKLTRVPSLWWLDVETTNTWQADVTANAASLTGMVDYFESRGLTIGIYSTSFQWKKIAGVTPADSSLAGLQSWLAGGTYVGAPTDCEKSPLTPGGRVAMIQFVTHLDNDYSCRSFSASASIAPSAPSVPGTVLTASPGAWASSHVSFGYQWSRNGKPIRGATSPGYVTTPADLGADITVTITGKAPGYSTAEQTSAPASVVEAMAPQPVSITGTFASGHALTVKTGTWQPSPVALSYAWYRGGTLVSSGTTAATYFLTAADVGQVITVTVSGSEPGYAPAIETAVSPIIRQ